MGRLGLLGIGLVFVGACAGSSGSTDSTGTGAGSGGPGGSVAVDLDGGGVPATPPDGAAACPVGACNYQSGTGCSGATSSCLPALAGGAATPACFAPGAVVSGGACVSGTDCVAGHLCVGGVCRKLCCGGDWTGCDSASEHCFTHVSYSSDAGVVATGAMVCEPVGTCDALAPTSCTQPGTTCQLADATGATACIPDGTGQAGDPCPCKGGFACIIPPAKSAVCVRLCKAVPGGGAPYCQANEGVCTHFDRDPPGVGECEAPTM